MARRSTIHEVIEEYRDAARSTSERGTRFEELMKQWFALDPVLSAEYDSVRLWSEWHHNENTHDSGIDLVARTISTGEWTAVQCKFYEPTKVLQKADIDSFFTASGKTWDGVAFTNRIIITTTDRWSHHAEKALENQAIPVQRIRLADLADSPIDWMFHDDRRFEVRRAVRHGLRPHQKEAVAKILEGFRAHDRGKWISACGTGKTFTSLKLAEQMCQVNQGALRVLFLAPSISLVSQSLREWMGQTQTDIHPFVVCSDTKASRQAEDISTHDIRLPTTDADRLAGELGGVGKRTRGMTVVFATYQSIDVVARAQRQGEQQFDLILCDEAHRTTGVKLAGQADESAFTRVHDNAYLPAAKRLYMTATPRIYGEAVRKKADEKSAALTSMDDEETFGPEFHRLGFGEAVEQRLLTDYKVMVLVVPGDALGERVQGSLATIDGELDLDSAAKIVGCWNGLAKRTSGQDFGAEPVPMKRAVAFCRDIKASKGFASAFPEVVEAVTATDSVEHTVAVQHVDGTMNALERGAALSWLKAPVPDGETRMLSNARCLSEGVDVPALDAVLFLHPRNSMVDVVQSVGRVMRRAKDKDYGYVILPVAVPAGMAPEEAMKDNRRFKVVWDVLNALRSHDERFEAMINSIDLDGDTKGKVDIDIIGKDGPIDSDADSGDSSEKPGKGVQLPLFDLAEWKDAILARIVRNCGSREYWDAWADDVVGIHANQTARINAILAGGDAAVAARFDAFTAGLRANLNESITDADAISMLSQHLITKPVFEALFAHDSFTRHNPVAQTMQDMIVALEGHGLGAETAKLTKFYGSVRRRAEAITTPAGRQGVVHELYEQFFKNAFPKQSSSLGVVYTPVEIVDFLLRAADDVCRQEFGYGLTDEGVHVLDPFTGTGTFIVRLLQSGIIRAEDLARKYAGELWANEIMLLAYYIACVNIETTYQALRTDRDADELTTYEPFPGALLTDTFQITEVGDKADTSLIPVNNERIERQLAAPITIVVGNPPYSTGQTSANDNNANLKYPTLDARIADTYAARSTATNKNSLYDSYIRAFRWATDRIGDQGVVAFVSNNGWVDGNTADGIRLTFADEFSDVYVYNLRGNQRTAGELSRQEGGKVFGSGARTGVAMLIGVRKPGHDGPARVHYFGVADYQTSEEKLAAIHDATVAGTPWRAITPNTDGDWLNQRNDAFVAFPALGHKDWKDTGLRHFALHSVGLKTNRDAWCYNFSDTAVESNMRRMIKAYNAEAAAGRTSAEQLDSDPKRISWSRGLVRDALRGTRHAYGADRVFTSLYRPFTKQRSYFDRPLNDMVYRLEAVFPTPHHENHGFLVIESGARSPFALLATNCIPDSKTYTDAAQFFPRWTYENAPEESLFAESSGGYRRIDNITDGILAHYRQAFGEQVTKDDIFAYVYGVLHSPQYREAFAADLKRMLPRIPLVANRDDFETFVDAGTRLLGLHITYEGVQPYPLHESTHPMGVDDWDLYRVHKLTWRDKTTKDAIVYNQYLTVSDIPKVAHRYMLGSRSALEWIIDRYQVKTDSASGIVNDPNDWAREHDDPRYIIDLIGRVTRVSVDTMRIVDSLPELPLSTNA